MGRWVIEAKGTQQVLFHYCDGAYQHDNSDILRQDLGGGYVRCDRCSEKFLPSNDAGTPRLLFRLKRNE